MPRLSAEQVGDKLVSVMDILEKKFGDMAKKTDEELDIELLIKLASAIGYQANVYSGLLKNHVYERRLERLENAMSMTDSKLAMELSPVIVYQKDIKEE